MVAQRLCCGPNLHAGQPRPTERCSQHRASYDAGLTVHPQPSSAVALVLAHQGGWDEMLLVLLPIGLFAALLAVANRRADRNRGGADQPEHPESG